MSICAGYKDVLVKSYEGDVLIKDIPNSLKKSDVIDIARQELKKTGLNNIEYIVNPNKLDLDFEFIKVVEYK